MGADEDRLDPVDGDDELGEVAHVGVEQPLRPAMADLSVGAGEHTRRRPHAGDELVQVRLPHDLQCRAVWFIVQIQWTGGMNDQRAVRALVHVPFTPR